MRRNEAGFYGAMALLMVGVRALVALPSQTSSSAESSSSSATWHQIAPTSTESSSVSAITTGVTEACGAGAECGSFDIISATLVYPGGAGQSNLTLALRNTGNVPVGYFEVYINNGTTPEPITSTPPEAAIQHPSSQLFYNGTVPAGETRTVSLLVPNTVIMIQPNSQYAVQVEGYVLPSGGGQPWANDWRSTTVMSVAG